MGRITEMIYFLNRVGNVEQERLHSFKVTQAAKKIRRLHQLEMRQQEKEQTKLDYERKTQD